MGNKYLTKEQLNTNLSLGKGVEQWLGHYDSSEETILKWINIYSEKGEYTVMYIECYDEGNVDNLDISDFTGVDPDEPYGLIDIFSTQDEAVAFSINRYNANVERFVNNGMIQEEYLSYLNNKAKESS